MGLSAESLFIRMLTEEDIFKNMYFFAEFVNP